MCETDRELRTLLISLALASGCGANSAALSPVTMQSSTLAGRDSQVLDPRELPVLKQQPFSLGWVGGAAESAEPLAFDDKPAQTAVVIPMGLQTARLCYLFKKPVRPAETLRRTVENASKGVHVRSLRKLNIATIADYPAIFLDLLYDAAEGSPGELKVMFYDHRAVSMLCTHDAPGYRATFERITTGLAASLKVQTASGPKFSELYLERTEETLVGFSQHEVTPTDNGFISVLRGATFIPISERLMEMVDTTEEEQWDAGGGLVEARYTEKGVRGSTTDLALQRVGSQEYGYQGKKANAYVSGTFQTRNKRGLVTALMLSHIIGNDLLSGRMAETRTEEFHPTVSASRPVEVGYEAESLGERRLKILFGSTVLSATADEHGLLKKVVPFSGIPMVTKERILVRGAL